MVSVLVIDFYYTFIILSIGYKFLKNTENTIYILVVKFYKTKSET